MKNLYERLKQEHKDVLVSEANKYENSVKILTDKLKLEHFWTELTYGDIAMIVSHLNLKSYDPVTITNLFES